jgi:hypothetical protein
MLTIETLTTLKRGTKLTYTVNGKAYKWRVNGKLKTTKTSFKLPIKHGLYQYGYILPEI